MNNNTPLIIMASFVICFITPYTLAQTVPPPVFTHSIYDDTFELQRIFPSSFADTIIKQHKAISPNMGGEIVHTFTVDSLSFETMTDKEIDLKVLQSIFSFSKQKGIEYYSHRRKKYRTFLTDIYRIASRSTRKESLSDFVPSVLKDTYDTIYLYQADTSFGNSVQKVKVSYNPDHEFYISTTNLTDVRYKGIFPVAEPNTFITQLFIKRDGNTFYTYGTASTKANTPLRFVRKRAAISITYRVLSLATWLETQMRRDFSGN